jgi:predicted TPR repeat methyltransferase
MTGFLDKVYGIKGTEQTRALYDDWAPGYDVEVADAGYATPARCAKALAGAMTDKSLPVLDVGCGTGLSGQALADAGFRTIDGRDLSPGMVEQARSKNVYRSLAIVGPDDPLPERYAAMAAIGVIGAGAAPISLLDRMIVALPPGGLAVFSFNDHTLDDPAYADRVHSLIGQGTVTRLFEERGPHLPSLGLQSIVYVLQKA